MEDNTNFFSSGHMNLFSYQFRGPHSYQEIVEQLTGEVILHFGGNILARISQLFDKYVDLLLKALTGTSEDDHLMELKEHIPLKAETDSQQLVLLGTAFTIAEELLPMVVS